MANNFNKKNNKRNKNYNIPAAVGTIEYKMSKTLSNNIISSAREKGNKAPAQEILRDYVNEQMHLKGYCVRVIPISD